MVEHRASGLAPRMSRTRQKVVSERPLLDQWSYAILEPDWLLPAAHSPRAEARHVVDGRAGSERRQHLIVQVAEHLWGESLDAQQEGFGLGDLGKVALERSREHSVLGG